MQIENSEDYKGINLVWKNLYHVNDDSPIKFVAEDDNNILFLNEDKQVLETMAIKDLPFSMIHKLIMKTDWFTGGVAMAVNKAMYDKETK